MSDGAEGGALAKRGRGRPSDFRVEYCEQVTKLARLGLTNEEMASFFEIGAATLKRWMGKHPDFRAALTLGRASSDAEVADRLFKRATGYSHPDVHVSVYEGAVTLTPITKHYPPDPTSMIFWLKNRRPDKWRDKREEAPADAEAAAAAIREILKATEGGG